MAGCGGLGSGRVAGRGADRQGVWGWRWVGGLEEEMEEDEHAGYEPGVEGRVRHLLGHLILDSPQLFHLLLLHRRRLRQPPLRLRGLGCGLQSVGFRV